MDQKYTKKGQENREGNHRESEEGGRGERRILRPRREYNSDNRRDNNFRERRDYNGNENRDSKPFERRGYGNYDVNRDRNRGSVEGRGGGRSDHNERNFNRDVRNPEGYRPRRDYPGGNGYSESKKFNNDRENQGRPEQGRPVVRRENGRYGERSDRSGFTRENRDNNFRERRPRQGQYSGIDRKERYERPQYNEQINKEDREILRQKHYSKKKILAHRLKNENEDSELRLNRYISMGGICSRRDADELIKTGRVKVNDVVVQSVGVKVQRKDKVEVDGVVVIPERKVYLALNKPKDYVTTVEDPMERKTVMSLIEGACKERIYPIGRLDRQTTGILLFTNDGDLAKKLTHPKYENKKIYHVFLDKVVSEQDMQAISAGIELEDGFIKADEISYASDDKSEVGIEIHSGKNRIVRRIFEHFGYQIIKLDRVYFAGITKKNLPRGKWRFLTTEEVNVLKFY